MPRSRIAHVLLALSAAAYGLPAAGESPAQNTRTASPAATAEDSDLVGRLAGALLGAPGGPGGGGDPVVRDRAAAEGPWVGSSAPGAPDGGIGDVGTSIDPGDPGPIPPTEEPTEEPSASATKGGPDGAGAAGRESGGDHGDGDRG